MLRVRGRKLTRPDLRVAAGLLLAVSLVAKPSLRRGELGGGEKYQPGAPGKGEAATGMAGTLTGRAIHGPFFPLGPAFTPGYVGERIISDSPIDGASRSWL